MIAIEKMGGAIQTDRDGGSAEGRTDNIFLDMDKNEDANLPMTEFIEGAKCDHDASVVKILQSGYSKTPIYVCRCQNELLLKVSFYCTYY